jgi:hypothetical protein
MVFARFLSLFALLFLMACGGGGGSGGGGGTSAPGPAVSLSNAEVPVRREVIQRIKVENLVLDDAETVTASVDGVPVPVAPVFEDELMFLLPPSLSGGIHELQVSIRGKAYRLEFESESTVPASRQESLNGLSSSFDALRTVVDETILELQARGASQQLIDELLLHRDTLAIDQPGIESLSDEELDYLNRFFALNLLSDVTAKSASRSAYGLPAFRGLEQCTARKAIYVRQFLRMVAVIGVSVGSLEVSMGLGPIAVALVTSGAAVAIYKELDQTLEELDHLVEHCLDPVFNSLQEALVSRSGMSLRTKLVEDDDRRIFEHDLAESYRLESRFEFIDEILDVLPKARTVLNKIAFLVPASIEDPLRARLADDYTEDLPVDSISLQDISVPEVTGDLIPTGDDTFDLVFRKDTGSPFESEFKFTLYDAKNDIATRYTARLFSDGHCPDFTGDLANVVLTAERCIVIQERPEIDALDYQEYQRQALVMREYYTIGDSPVLNLKTLKGLDDYDHIPDLQVERVDRYIRYQVLEDVEGKPSARKQEITYSEEGNDVERFYSEPLLQNHDGYMFWDAVISQEVYYYDDYPGPVYARVTYSDPLQDDSGLWRSVQDRTEYYDEAGEIVEWTAYAEPVMNLAGVWLTVEQESHRLEEDDNGSVTRTEWRRHPPRLTDSGELRAPESTYRVFVDDVLTDEYIHSQPLKSAEGDWQSVMTLSFTGWNGFTETRVFSSPLQDASGNWVSVSASQTSESDSGVITEHLYSQPLQDSRGDWESVHLSVITTDAGGDPLSEQFYSEPLQTSYGSWQSVRETSFAYEAGELSSSEVYSDPFQLSSGTWGSALANTTTWSGSYRNETTYSGALEQFGAVVSTMASFKRYDNDVLVQQSLYSQALSNDDGSWTSVIQDSRQYSGGQLVDRSLYRSPIKRPDGYWDVALAESTTWSGSGRVEYTYSGTLVSPEGDYVTSLISNRKHYLGATLDTEYFYASPYLDNFNTWATYLQRINYYSRDCYQTRNQSGSVVTDTCTP